jgi:hypothetical protein
MRPTRLALIAATVLLSACAGMEYRDPNAAVDARPECDGSVGRPGEPVPAWCDRTGEASWSSESDSAGIDFGVGEDDD